MTERVKWRDAKALRGRIKALESERDMLREILQMFVAHYPHGINPHCDEARYKARAVLKGDQT